MLSGGSHSILNFLVQQQSSLAIAGKEALFSGDVEQPPECLFHGHLLTPH